MHQHTIDQGVAKPKCGMVLTFTTTTSAELAGIPATITFIWPRFRSGDYLVTLEYAEPVKLGKQLIRHIDAFINELVPFSAPKNRFSKPTFTAAHDRFGSSS